MQALLLLHKLQTEFEITGALHLDEVNTILFQFDTRNYLLMYGEYSKFISTNDLTIDIDDGFLTRNTPLRIILNTYFELWKANNYEGRLIPTYTQGFTLPSQREDAEHLTGAMLKAFADFSKITKVTPMFSVPLSSIPSFSVEVFKDCVETITKLKRQQSSDAASAEPEQIPSVSSLFERLQLSDVASAEPEQKPSGASATVLQIQQAGGSPLHQSNPSRIKHQNSNEEESEAKPPLRAMKG